MPVCDRGLIRIGSIDMGYKFNFDLTKLPSALKRELTKLSKTCRSGAEIKAKAERLVKKYRINKLVNISVADATAVIGDLLAIRMQNRFSDARTQNGNGRYALLLPHCARKHMDRRCRAEFNTELSFYTCMKCSSDCLINWASQLGKKMGCDVYVLPGGSCLGKILGNKRYDAIIGIACGDEIRLAKSHVGGINTVAKGIPLLKNGCAKTRFSRRELKKVLAQTVRKPATNVG